MSLAGAQNQAQPASQTQTAAANGTTGTPGVVLAHSVVNFAELARKEKLHPPKRVSQKAVQHRQAPKHTSLPPGAIIKFSPTLAPSVSGGPTAESATTPIPRSPNLNAGFQALLDDQTVIPPDTQGTVGQMQLMVTLNSQVVVQNKSGGIQKTVSLDAFWNSVLGPPPAGFTGIATTDPRVVYDPYADRWITSAAAYPASTAAGVLVGVSQNSDATGFFNLYKVAVDSTNQHFCDFPILGFNSQWVVVMCNVFANNPNVNFFAGNIYVFNKAALYANTPGAGTPIVLDTQGDSNVTPASTYDPNLTNEYLVEEFCGISTACGATGTPMGLMRLWTISGPVGAPVLNNATTPFPATSLTWDESAPGDFAPQAGAAPIDTGTAGTTNVVYRNGNLWTAHTVFLPSGGSPNRASAQWWELGTDGTVLQNGLIDNPDGSVFRAYPSIAVNKNDDALVGYSLFTPSGHASAYYSFRGHTDPPSFLQSEALLHPGQAPYFKTYSGTNNRWGDYSNTAVDPADDIALWTIQEYADFPVFVNGQSQSTWGTWWGEVVPPLASFAISQLPPPPVIAGTMFNFRVTANDAYGDLVPSYSGTVQFTSTDPTAIFSPSNYKFLPGADVGTHVFSATLTRAGTQTILVSDAAAGVRSSFTILVTSAAPKTLLLAAPATVTKGVPFNLTVTALDAFANRATGYTGTTHFTSSDGAATLPANYTFTSLGDSGRHVFPVTLNTLASQTVTATDTFTPSITGNTSITVANISGALLQVRVRLGHVITVPLATFTDASNPSTPANLTASINWGDGSPLDSNTTITGPSGGVFTVAASAASPHKYLRPPKGLITITVTDTASGTTGSISGPVRFWPKTESH